MSARQLAGQRVIYGYPGLTPPDNLLDLISRGEAAGVIFFSDNISSAAQLQRVIGMLARANASPDNPVRAPLLLMTDQEGGRIRRLPGPPLLSERQIGVATDPRAAATKAGGDAGRYLRGIGINVNLAPVLDVYRTAGDFDDRYGRSYSMDPRVVADLGARFIRAQQHEGVAATAKHFPGLGAATTTQDTDAGPVTLNLSLNALSAIDEVPFRSAVTTGVRLVMVSWAKYPALDRTSPAGLSAIVLRRLRHDIGFSGVTLSDGILADALVPYGGVGRRAQLAARAGVDLLICAKLRSPTSVGTQAREGLERGYAEDTLNRGAFRDSVERVIALRRSLED